MGLIVKIFPRGPLSENTYVLTDEKTGRTAVLDPGYYGEDVLSAIQDVTHLSYILLTHGHYDHFAAAEKYMEMYPSAIFAAPDKENYLLHGGRDNKWMALGKGTGVCPEAGMLLKEGDTVTLGETVLRVIETPGHTEGGICFVTDKEVFTGDTLFRLSVGNTALETGDRDMLERSIQDKLYALDDDLIVWPGHGAATTIGYEKKANPFVQAKQDPTPVELAADGTEHIGNGEFSGRDDLVDVIIPDSVREIGTRAFASCTALEKIVLPANLRRIRKELFSGCTALKTVRIPDGVTDIGEWAFRGCVSLEKAIIPGSVTDIAAEAFLSCPGVTIISETGSYAESYAAKFGIPFKAEYV